MSYASAPGVLRLADRALPARITESARAADGGVLDTAGFHAWLERARARHRQRVERIPFRALRDWEFHPLTGNLCHRTGRFFTVHGLHVRTDTGPVGEWYQPIINQPEIGILGIAVKEIDGLLHCLMQAKIEPGNVNGVQLSPTVQATKSNYTRVHEGRAVPYLEHFIDPDPGRVLADVLQSEQGSWFYGKRNRNMIVEVGDEVEAGDDFCWLTLGQLNALMRIDNLVNMDARTVLSCMPGGLGETAHPAGSLSTDLEVLSWITGRLSAHEIAAEPVPLPRIERWIRDEYRIRHELGVYFSVIAVDVATDSREVSAWTQPLIEPHGVGECALLVRDFDGVPHALVNARMEPGYRDVVEIAPTVQCTVANYAHLPPSARPRYLDVALGAPREAIRFEAELSEEGGRFYHARSRYSIIEVDDGFPVDCGPDFKWLTLPQLTGLLRHSHYVNVQARTLVAAWRGLS
jgi:oxidase EvaA